MSKPILSIVCLCATIVSAMSEAPQISLEPANCLSDGSGTPGICALSNVKRIELEVTFDPRGNNALKSLGETALNPSAPVPSNYLVVRVVDNQSGASLSVKVGAHGAAQKDNKQLVYVNLEILEDASVRQGKMQ